LSSGGFFDTSTSTVRGKLFSLIDPHLRDEFLRREYGNVLELLEIKKMMISRNNKNGLGRKSAGKKFIVRWIL